MLSKGMSFVVLGFSRWASCSYFLGSVERNVMHDHICTFVRTREDMQVNHCGAWIGKNACDRNPGKIWRCFQERTVFASGSFSQCYWWRIQKASLISQVGSP